jgi:dTDP-4-dehydrorhamnose 3,5-epimerase
VTFDCQPLAALPEVKVFTPRPITDARGAFYETWHTEKFSALGLEARFVQDNQSNSAPGVLRGLHYQLPPFDQGKLIRAVVGEIFDVAVDIRRGSPAFGRWVGRLLSAENREMLWVPSGFAHGFYVTRGEARVVYKCTALYSPEHERILRWDDPDLAIDWPLASGAAPALSPKDAAAPGVGAAELFE